MFENIGSKIKGLAKTIFIILVIIVFMAVCAIIITSRGDSMSYLIALLTAVVGCVVSWLSVIILYAFGELVDNSTKIAESISKH